MKKYLILFIILLMPITVNATDANTSVSNNITYDECMRFQDNNIRTSGSGFFGHCIKAKCYTGIWELKYLVSQNTVTCTNGNKNPYINIYNNGCSQYT